MLELRITQTENGYLIEQRGPNPGMHGKQYVAETIEKLQEVIGELADKEDVNATV